MDGGGSGPAPNGGRTADEVFRDYRARRAGMIKALTTGTPPLASPTQIRASGSVPGAWIRAIDAGFSLCAVQRWTGSSSSVTPVSALDLFGSSPPGRGLVAQEASVVLLLGFRCFGGRLEAKFGEFSAFSLSSTLSRSTRLGFELLVA